MVKSKTKSKHSKVHNHKKCSHLHKIYKTKRKTIDHDQIHENLKAENCFKLLNQTEDHDLTGSAQHYCLHCARYFIDDHALQEHFKTKPHKRRMKALETEPFTQAEADRAAGMGSFVKPKKFEIKTQPSKEEFLKLYAENKTIPVKVQLT